MTVKSLQNFHEKEHQDKFHKYEKPKPKKYAEKDFHKNRSKINQY